LGTEIKSDEALPHLRAEAGIYASALADELLPQIEAKIQKEDKANKKAFDKQKLNYGNKA